MYVRLALCICRPYTYNHHACVCVCPPLRSPRTSFVERVSDPCIRPDVYTACCLFFLSIILDIHQICCGKLGIQQGSHHTLWSLSYGRRSVLGALGKRQICLCVCQCVRDARSGDFSYRQRALDNNSGNISRRLMNRFKATLDELELKEHHIADNI